MASDLFGAEAPEADAEAPVPLPEPPPPEGSGLFGDAPPPVATPAPAPVVGVAPPAYRVLARKYRPNDFQALIGQDALVRTLRNAFAQSRIPHALLLAGVRGVGKTTTARIIARALNCIGPDGTGGPTIDPCGVCPECLAILADRHPDVLELDAASNRGIDDVRELREMMRYRPAQGRYKVVILDEAHMLTTQANNALLKTLEEPPPQVAFMLATTEPRNIPVTIRSRCQTHYLKRVPEAVLAAHYARVCAAEAVSAEPDALAMIARAAEGSVRDGLSLLDQAIAQAGGAPVAAATVREMLGLADRGMALDLLEAALRGDLPAALALADRAHLDGADPGVLLADLLALVHTLTRFVTVPSLADAAALEESLRTRGAALAATLSVPVLGRAWQMLLKGIGELDAAPDRRAAADMVLIRLAHVAALPTPGDILKRLQDVPADAPVAPAPSSGGAGGAQALAAPVAVAEAAPPMPRTWPEIVALASGATHAWLRQCVHPVAIASGRLEIRVTQDAPRDLAAQLAATLLARTGTRWTVVLSNAEGAPTLDAQGDAAEAGRRDAAARHPLVQAVLATFPGATIEAVRDAAADAYGLTPAAPPPMDADPSMPTDPDEPDELEDP